MRKGAALNTAQIVELVAAEIAAGWPAGRRTGVVGAHRDARPARGPVVGAHRDARPAREPVVGAHHVLQAVAGSHHC